MQPERALLGLPCMLPPPRLTGCGSLLPPTVMAQAHAGGDGLFVRLARRVYEASSSQSLRFQGVFVNGGVDEVCANCVRLHACRGPVGPDSMSPGACVHVCNTPDSCPSAARAALLACLATSSAQCVPPPRCPRSRTQCTTLWTTCSAPTRRPTAPTAPATPTASHCCW